MSRLVSTEDTRVARDVTSTGLVATNVHDLRKSRIARRAARQTQQQQRELDRQFAELRARVARCEELLATLVPPSVGE